MGLETTLNRPIINTRDEPHADAERYRRLHVIGGDANLFDVSTYLKVGTTALLLWLLENDAVPLQLDALSAAGGDRVFVDKASGKLRSRAARTEAGTHRWPRAARTAARPWTRGRAA